MAPSRPGDSAETRDTGTSGPFTRGIPFRIWLPGAMLLFTLGTSIWSYTRYAALADAFIERNAMQDLPLEAGALQRSTEYLLAKDAREQVQQALADKRADPDVVAALVVDENDMILASAVRSQIGEPFAPERLGLGDAASRFDFRQTFESVRARRIGQIARDADTTHLMAVYPLVLGSVAGELRPRRIGAVLLLRDLTRMKATERAATGRSVWFAILPIVAFAAFVYLLAQRTVGRRANRLVDTARRFARGEQTARATLDGHDELAEIGNAFDEMADRIVQTRAVLTDNEVRLRLSEERFRLALDASPGAMVLTDEQGVISLVNREAERLFGYSRDELLGQPVDVLVPPLARTSHGALRASFREESSAQRGGVGRELLGLRKDGREVSIEIGLNPIRSEQGLFVLASIVDVTDRKRAEAERLQLETQLRQSQKMDALGTLAGGIAHDFNNILGVILGNVWLLEQQPPPPPPMVTVLAQEIAKAGARAKQLVHQILRFTRQEAEQVEVLQLGAVIADDLSLLRATLPAGVELTCDVMPGCPPVMADRTSIHQVLVNLCTNAWHAMEGRAGRIAVRLEAVTVSDEQARGHLDLRPGPYVRLTVSDNGKGMDALTQEKMFDPFFTTKPVGQGTGLGLSVVHGVITALRGAVVVHSAPGRGSAFELYIPPCEDAVPTAVALVAATPTVRAATGQHVMYVDDEELLIRLAERVLSRSGYRVSVYTSAQAAITALKASPSAFDIVITDLNMPATSGLELAQMVGELRPDLPVILTSGFITDDLRARARAAGVRSLLAKPYTGDQLDHAIIRQLTLPQA